MITKEAARKIAFAARKAVHLAADDALRGAATRALNAALAPHRGAVVAGYMPIRTEIDPLPALTQFAAQGGAACMPVVLGPGQALVFRAWQPGCRVEVGAFGAAIPAADIRAVPSVLIVPMLAFDGRLYRLGYGGGFYDRTLAGLRAAGPVTAIGFAYSAQAMGAVPTEPTDEPLDMIITENGRFSPKD